MSFPEQVAALSGVVQAARLVDRIAVAGTCPSAPFGASINTLFTFDAQSTEDVYAGFDTLTLGLETLVALFGKTPDASLQHVLRYTLGILHLERKFSADRAMQNLVQTRLEHVAYKAAHFTNDPRSLSHNIAAIYQDSLSQLSFRIKIIGNSEYPKSVRDKMIAATPRWGGISRITFQMSTAALETEQMQNSITLLGAEVTPGCSGYHPLGVLLGVAFHNPFDFGCRHKAPLALWARHDVEVIHLEPVGCAARVVAPRHANDIAIADRHCFIQLAIICIDPLNAKARRWVQARISSSRGGSISISSIENAWLGRFNTAAVAFITFPCRSMP